MGKHLSKYQTEEDYNNNEDTHVKPHISYIVNPTKKMIYIPKPYIEQYFTIEALEDDLTISLSQNNCEYCINNGNWNTLSANTNTPSINKGQTLSFRGNLTPNSGINTFIISPTPPDINNNSGIGTFNISKNCNIKGNIMSLLYGDDFIGQNDLSDKVYAFYKLFYNCKTIIDASKLILPAITLGICCYAHMFDGCIGLTTTPELPATTLANDCYSSMFYNCTNLTAASELPATTLANRCYQSMFGGCTSLISAPELPATTLADGCYQSMFDYCTSLVTAPELPATTLADGCYQSMFDYCASLVTAPELPATTLANACYSCMFINCTNLTAAPELPATTLADKCYMSMFSGCTNLTSAPELPATILASWCYNHMFSNCSKLNYIKMLATDISASSCLYYWVNGVSIAGTFVKNAVMTSLPRGISGIPTGWTVKNYNESNLITFTIDGTEYQAEEGMTWEEWCNSEYNKIQMLVINTGVQLIVGLNPPYSTLIGDSQVYGQDLIITDGVYKNRYNDF